MKLVTVTLHGPGTFAQSYPSIIRFTSDSRQAVRRTPARGCSEGMPGSLALQRMLRICASHGMPKRVPLNLRATLRNVRECRRSPQPGKGASRGRQRGGRHGPVRELGLLRSDPWSEPRAPLLVEAGRPGREQADSDYDVTTGRKHGPARITPKYGKPGCGRGGAGGPVSDLRRNAPLGEVAQA